jgi:hypothetical protein
VNIHTPTATAIPALNRGMLDEEVAVIVREMWGATEPREVTEEAWYNAASDIERAAQAAHKETIAWLALHERQLAGEHVEYGVAFDARERLQDAHKYHADLVSIAAIGNIGESWHLRPHSEFQYGLAEDGDDDALMTVPRGLPAGGYRAIARAYRTGSEHGRRDLQRDLRALLGAAA